MSQMELEPSSPESIRSRLQQERETLRQEFLDSWNSLGTLRKLSDLNDKIVEELYRKYLSHQHVSVFAIGGYGRREMFPSSDLDLLVLDHSRAREAEAEIKEWLQALWDLDYRVGQQVWRWSALEAVGSDDLEFLLALSDARPLAGHQGLQQRLLEEFVPARLRDFRAELTQFLVDWTRRRHQRFRDTIYQLEPDLKDAPGGLRDFQIGRWMIRLTGSACLLPYRPQEVEQAFAFVSGLRILLHFLQGRDRNQLSHELQQQVAPLLGYGHSRRSAVESLMKEYFLRARVLSGYCRKSIESLSGPPRRLLDLDQARDLDNLQRVLEVFERALSENCSINDWVRRRILANLPRLSEGLSYAALAQPVLRLFQPRSGLYQVLSELYELGVLELLFPEFASIRARVIRDFYHRYTVDEHSLLAIQAVEELAAGENPVDSRFRSLLQEEARPELLTLTLLLHDVGKGRGGKHVDTGARMATRALRRYRFDQEQIDTITFLIRNHLAMSSVMSRRDITDPAEIGRFADLVGDVPKLRLLCLLTYADIKAVAPGTLNQWKRDRLWQLYVATYNRLTLGYGEERVEREIIRDKLAPELPADIELNSLETFLQGFPRRYLLVTPPQEIFQHYRLGRAVTARQPVQVNLAHRRSHWELCVVTADRHRMFSRIAGLLASFGMNILRGYAFSNRRDTVLDFFQFDDTGERFRFQDERRRFRDLLVKAIQDQLDVETLLRRRETSVLLPPQTETIAPVVRFDSDSAGDYSIVEIVASDSVGLLYRISREIANAGCNIELVLISTEGNKAVDVFYLTHGGAKLKADLRARLQASIIGAIAGGERTKQTGGCL